MNLWEEPIGVRIASAQQAIMRRCLWWHLIGALIIVVWLGAPSKAAAATCTATSAGQFTSCLSTVACGDTITLTAGTVFVGEFTYAKACTSNPVTITSDSSAANFPAAGYRISPAYAGFMPKLHSTWDAPHANSAALTVAENASGLIVTHVEFWPSYRDSNGSIIDIGDYYGTTRAGQPDNVTFDQVYCNGDGNTADPYAHVHRCFGVFGKNVTIKNSYLHHITCAVLSDDSSGDNDCLAIWSTNNEGPLVITNNWINGATYGFLSGGSDINRKTIATITGSITSTSAAINWTSGDAPWVGAPVAVATNSGTTIPCWAWVTAFTPATGTSGTITWDTDTTTAGNQGCTDTPVSPGDVRWGVQPGTLSFTMNRVENDSDIVTGSIVPKPTGFSASSSGSGSLTAGTYTVYLIAEATGQQGGTLRSKYTTGQAVTVGASGRIVLSWTGVASATGYKAYVQAPDASWSYTNFGAVTSGALTAAGTSAAGLPTYHLQRIKNFLETKTIDGATIQYNVFRNHASLDVGYAMWFKNASQGCNEDYQVSRNIEVADNRFEHVNGALLIVGTDYATQFCANDPRPTKTFSFHDNVVWDSSPTWDFHSNSPWAFSESNGPIKATIEHNTIDHTGGSGALSLVNQYAGFHCLTFRMANNVLFLSAYGLRSQGAGVYPAQTDATAALNAECDAVPTWTVTANAWAYDVLTYGGYATGTFPSGNLFPTVGSFTANFTNYAAGDFSLVGGSTWLNAGTDGKNLGADQTAFLARQSAIENGTPFGAATSSASPTSRLRLRF